MPRKKKTVEENKKVEKPAEAVKEDLEEKKKKLIETSEFENSDSDQKSKKVKMIFDKAKKLMEEKILVKEAKVELKEEKTTEKAEEKKEKEAGKKEESGTLIPVDDYVKAGVYIGTKVITPNMRQFVYRRRADGIAIINTNIVDEKLKEAGKILANYKPSEWIVVCKREAGWRAVKLFSELTGVKVFTKKYPAGIITNLSLSDFFETELIFICDPWLDKNALNDAVNVRKKVMSICDTNNLSNGVDYVVPANNKSNKSLGIIFYILAREYMKSQGIDKKLPEMEEFIGEKLESLPARKTKAEKAAEKEKVKDIEKIESILKVDKEE